MRRREGEKKNRRTKTDPLSHASQRPHATRAGAQAPPTRVEEVNYVPAAKVARGMGEENDKKNAEKVLKENSEKKQVARSLFFLSLSQRNAFFEAFYFLFNLLLSRCLQELGPWAPVKINRRERTTQSIDCLLLFMPVAALNKKPNNPIFKVRKGLDF